MIICSSFTAALYDKANFNAKANEFSTNYLSDWLQIIQAEVKKLEDHLKYKELQHQLYVLLACRNNTCEFFFVIQK